MPPREEEVSHEFRTFFGKYAFHHLRLRVQGIGGVDGVSAFRVARAVDELSHLCPAYCTGAHGARLNGYIDCALVKVFPAQIVGCRRDGLHFGVSRYVAERFGKVVRACYNAVAA